MTMMQSWICWLGYLVFGCSLFPSITWVQASTVLTSPLGSESGRCQRQNVSCGLTAAQAQLMYLTPYNQLMDRLKAIYDSFLANGGSVSSIQYGPLIQNGESSGILNIDVPLATVCNSTISNCTVCEGTQYAATNTLRQAMLCTVLNDPFGYPARGNTNPTLIGKSTYGRDLLALRIGNLVNGTRVLMASQIHGSEAASTEAFLAVLEQLVSGQYPSNILAELDLLFIIRANPDGGEPTASNLGDNYERYFNRSVRYIESAYFFRQNVDPRAGGNFGAVDGRQESEPGFYGVVGRGYDLNRYTFAGLNVAIRPVESQALVATLLAFRPRAVYDGHGDVQKAPCRPKWRSLRTASHPYLGTLPVVECAWPAPSVPTLATARKYMTDASVIADNENKTNANPVLAYSQAIASAMAARLEQHVVGQVLRFSQLQLDSSVGTYSGGRLADGVLRIGAVMNGVEIPNFGTDWRAAPLQVQLASDNTTFEPVYGLDLHLIEPCYLVDNICLHQVALEGYLMAIPDVVDNPNLPPLKGPFSFCRLPIKHQMLGSFPPNLGWGFQGFVDPKMVPSGGELFVIPTDISGSCRGDRW